MRILDISPLLSPRTAVFPGDVPLKREISLEFPRGDHLLLSSLSSTLHLGAHTDAPNHYHPDGVGIDSRPLDRYLGSCQVISVRLPRGERIMPGHIAGHQIAAPRVLFNTGSFPNPDRWNGDFNSLSPELIHWLAGQGVILVGIDTPSVDPAEDKGLSSHRAIYERDLAILEGIVLGEIRDGIYTLIALPLKLSGMDASPVRAVLLETETETERKSWPA